MGAVTDKAKKPFKKFNWPVSDKDAVKAAERDASKLEEDPNKKKKSWGSGTGLLHSFVEKTRETGEPQLEKLSERLQSAKNNQDAVDALWDQFFAAIEDSRRPTSAGSNSAVTGGVQEQSTQTSDTALEISRALEQSRQEKQDLERRLSDLQTQLGKAENLQKEAENKAKQARSDYMTTMESLSRVSTENHDLRVKLIPFEKAGENIATATERLEAEKRNLQAEIHILHTKSAAATRDCDTLEQEVTRLKQEVATLDFVNDSHLKRVEIIGEVNRKEKAELHSSFDQRVKAINEEHNKDRLRLLALHQADVTRLQEARDKRVQSLKDRIDNLEQELEDQATELNAKHEKELNEEIDAYNLLQQQMNAKEVDIGQAILQETRRQEGLQAIREAEWTSASEKMTRLLTDERTRHSDIERQWRAELTSLQGEKDRALTTANSSYQTHLREERSRHMEEKNLLESKLTSIKAEAERVLTEERSEHAADLKEVEEDLKRSEAEWKREVIKEASRNDAKIKELEQQHQEQENKLMAKYQVEMNRAEATWRKSEQELNLAAQRWQHTYEKEKEASKGKLKEFKDQSQLREDDVVRQFNQEKAALKKAQEEERVSIARKLRDLQSKHGSEIDELHKNYKAKIEQLEDDILHANKNLAIKHEAQIKEMKADRASKEMLLRREIDAKDDFLVQRENFTPISDRELKERFADFLDDVDYLARQEWKFNHTAWTDEILATLAKQPQQKRLRKEILQDSIWLILYEHLFSSPFRILGPKGKELEEEWNEEFGEDAESENRFYTWPEPDVKAETWRYRTMKYCQEALYEPSSKLSKETAIKNEFRTSFQLVVDLLLQLLGQVSEVDEETTTTVRDLVKKATAAWIKMGTQWCRVVVVLPQSSMKLHKERLERAKMEGLELVSVAALKRFGNSRGQDMEKCDTITESVLFKVATKK